MRALAVLLLLAATAAAADKLSPFTDVKFDGETPLVLYEGEWYELLEFEKVGAAELVAFCKDRYGEKWDRRIAEDIVEVFEAMGKRLGRGSVSLVLRYPGGKRKRVAKARMTEDNRDAVRDARRRRERFLDAKDAAADLEFLKEFLAERYSYRFRFEDALDRFVWKGGDVARDAFALHVARLVSPFGDGHTRVRGRWDWLPRGYAPFVCGVSGERLVALEPGGRALLDDGHPYLAAIDGRPVADWIAAAQGIFAQGSPQFRLWTAAEYVGFLAFLRRELGLPDAPAVEIELESEKGARRKLRRSLADRPAPPPTLPGRETGLLDGNVGYLRLREMRSDARFLDGLRRAMEDFRGTNGLVIDVRGNGGGARLAILTLLPHLLDAPRVVNAAKYRLPADERPERPAGHLENRFLYPLPWTGWTPEQRRAIEAFRDGFRPEWEPPAGPFTAWHYMVVSPSPNFYRYEKPVVVLMDAHCFSATDIFLAAFKGVDGVTLMGVPSGGGSGRSRKVTLPKSGVKLRVSSMASFQPDGRLYDGNGVAPDVRVDPVPADWTGATDTMLDAALARLRGSRDSSNK